MIKYLYNREIGFPTRHKFNNILEKKCIIELQKNKLDLFYEMIELGCYNIEILIDSEKTHQINELCHHIDIVFVNNIQNKRQIMDKVLLVDLYIEDYYFMTLDGTILQWNKTIKRNQTSINYKEIQLEPYVLLQVLTNSLLERLLLLFVRNIIIYNLLLHICFVFYFQFL
jgi:hypothetical protein